MTLNRILDNRQCFKVVCGAGNESPDYAKKIAEMYIKAGANYVDVSCNVDVVKSVKEVIPKGVYLNVSLVVDGDIHKVGSFDDDLKKLPEIIKIGIDSIELHASVQSETRVVNNWTRVEALWGGIMSLCIDRGYFGDNYLRRLIDTIAIDRKPHTTIIQADGLPISGTKNDYNTTLQAVACCDIVNKMNIPVYLIASGGTNEKTGSLLKKCGVRVHGIAVGSYARLVARNEGLKGAKKLVKANMEALNESSNI